MRLDREDQKTYSNKQQLHNFQNEAFLTLIVKEMRCARIKAFNKPDDNI